MSQQLDRKALKKFVTANVMTATTAIEEKVDEELHKLDSLKVDDLEELRERRLQELKKQRKVRDELMAKGHGEYSELQDQQEFFRAPKRSDRLVVHFYRKETPRCAIFDHHLQLLAKKHIETKFCKLLADNSLFVAERLGLWIIPTLIVIKDGTIRDYIIGFSDLGNTDNFSTDMLEWRLALTEVINYDGDITKPPGAETGKKVRLPKRTGEPGVRSSNDWTDDDEDLADEEDKTERGRGDSEPDEDD